MSNKYTELTWLEQWLENYDPYHDKVDVEGLLVGIIRVLREHEDVIQRIPTGEVINL